MIFLLLVSGSPIQEHNSSDRHKTVSDTLYDALTEEWMQFQSFEKKLRLAETSQPKKDSELKNYTRDSLKILEVKLMAIKLLEDRNLLRQDIVQNTQFYFDLLSELESSEVHPNSYRFLKESLILYQQDQLERKLGRSQWLNIGLGAVVLCFGIVIVLLKRTKEVTVQQLSRQETTIRNLILQGKSNKEIADELFISLSTVKTHITNIYGKLQVSNRQELLHKIQN